MADDSGHIWRALWRDKMHVEAGALDLVPASIRATYTHIWQPAEILMADLRTLPAGLLHLWQSLPQGHLLFTHRSSGYRPGPQPWRDTTLDGLCDLSIVDLRQDKRRALVALFNLLDHLLGSAGLAGGPWFSDGAGITADLATAAARLVRIYDLGHWQGEFPVQDRHAYLAHAWWLYLDDPQRLNTIDPLVSKLLAGTLMHERFWAQQRGDAQQAP